MFYKAIFVLFVIAFTLTSFLNARLVEADLDLKRFGRTQKKINNNIVSDKSKNLLALAKTYGYVKYFHPSDEATKIDWDAFGVLASQRVIESNDLHKTLLNLFLPIAPSFQIHNSSKKTSSKSVQNDKQNNELFDIYWQHLGTGESKVGAIYKSARVNRKAYVLPNSPNDFGGLRKGLSVEILKGKEIKFSGKIRPNSNYFGRPYLMLRYKPKNSEQVEVSSIGQKLNKDFWNSHTFLTKIPQDVEKITLYLISVGQNGSVDFDDLQLKYKENNKWINFDLKNLELDENKKFRFKWIPWGVNQDKDIVSNAKNEFLRVSRTKGKLQNIPPVFNISSANKRTITKKIGLNLSVTFPVILKGNKNNTFPLSNKNKYEKLVRDIDLIKTKGLSANNVYVRLANIIKVWSMMQHFFPYFGLTEVDWEKQFHKAVRKSMVDKNIEDHIETLKLMIYPLNDSHIGVFHSSLKDYYPSIYWELIENKLVITKVLDSNLTVNVGDVVTKINDKGWKKYWKKAYGKSSGATKTRKNYRAIGESLKGKENSVLSIEIKSKQKNTTLKIKIKRNLTNGKFNSLLKKNDKTFEEIKTGVFYVNLTKISWSDLKNRIPILAKAKGIIFDLRGYPKWQTINIVSHFTKKNLETTRKYIPQIVYPEQLDKSLQLQKSELIKPAKPFIKAKKVFITNGSAISYSETFLNLIEFYKLADIVGEQTAGSTGNVNFVRLLDGVSIPWTGMKVLRQDGSIFHGRGVLPNHPVKRTIKGIKEGRDEYIEYALKLIRTK